MTLVDVDKDRLALAGRHIIIRADASLHIGSGHVMRCLVLTNALRNLGHQVSFVCRPQRGDLISWLRSKGIEVLALPAVADVVPKHSADYVAWLQVPWRDDADDVRALIKNNPYPDVDLVIVDHYSLNKDWQRQVRASLRCQLVVIDDLVREHDADVIVDQTLARRAEEYLTYSPQAEVLAGCDYALLNPAFARYRECALTLSELMLKQGSIPVSRQAQDDLAVAAVSTEHSILLSMGGVDKPNATLNVLQALAGNLASAVQVTVLLGRQAPHYPAVAAFCQRHSSWVRHIDFVDNMAELMLTHCIAIGAPGATTWERACLGLPSIIIPLAANQTTICRHMVTAQAAISVDLDRIDSTLLPAYQQLSGDWFGYSQRNLALCDGLGVRRVMTVLQRLLVLPLAKSAIPQLTTTPIQLRRAVMDDIATVYGWQCAPQTRRYALNPAAPDWHSHCQWMENKLSRYQDYFYIIERAIVVENTSNSSLVPLGGVRLDRTGESEYLISIFLDPDYYGQGIATQALRIIDQLHAHVRIVATVLADNLASQRLFTQAHYQRINAEQFVREGRLSIAG